MKRTIIFIAGLILLTIQLGAGPQPIVTSDLLKIRRITTIDVAADGSFAIFALRSIAESTPDEDTEKDALPDYAYQSHLYQINLFDENPAARQLTHGKRSDQSPTLSPNGKIVAFVRKDELTEKPQVWILPLSGGEARVITNLEHGASNPRWSPDGQSLLVSSSIPLSDLEGNPAWPMERPGRAWGDAGEVEPNPDGTRPEIQAWLKRNTEQNIATVMNRIEFQDEHSLKDEMTFEHLFLFAVNKKESESTQISGGFQNFSSARFLPDGQRIVYITKNLNQKHPDRVRPTELWIMNLDGSESKKILADPTLRFSAPRPAADGTVIALLGQKLDEPAFRPRQLGLVSVEGDAPPLWLTDKDHGDISVWSFRWMAEKNALLFNAARKGAFPLMMVSQGLVEPALYVGKPKGEFLEAGIFSFDIGGPSLVYTTTTPANPCTLRLRNNHGDRLLFDPNDWVKKKQLSKPQEHWLTQTDGTRIHYWIMPPANQIPDKKYPVVLELHGGPSAMWGPGEFTMWHEFQLLTSRGYGVVYANPRGSGGYGYDFQKANFQNWGEGPTEDVLAALNEALLNDWIDPNRLVLTGGSYGGYLTAWIVGHDNRFQAAVAQRGVYDLTTFFGEGNAWRLCEWAMGGLPWEARTQPILDRESPFTYVQRIQTPLLIMHGSADLRTGVSQSEMMYRALKELNRPVEYVRYPKSGHDLSRTGDPIQRMDRLNRIIEFFDRFVGEKISHAP